MMASIFVPRIPRSELAISSAAAIGADAASSRPRRSTISVTSPPLDSASKISAQTSGVITRPLIEYMLPMIRPLGASSGAKMSNIDAVRQASSTISFAFTPVDASGVTTSLRQYVALNAPLDQPT